MGIWILRNMIIKKGGKLNDIHVIYSKLSNQSIIKACNILNIENTYCLNIDKKQRIDYEELIKKCEEIIAKNEKNLIKEFFII
jgi:glutamate/tyrosine decarboxylase-like PLP-dependent enzyme